MRGRTRNLLGPLAVATAAGAALTMVAVPYATADGSHNSPGAKPTVVLVHGAFADASGWTKVAQRLQDDGYPVIAPANPLRGLPQDSTYIASILKSVQGPIVLVGHSYGGAVISQAAADNPNVKALVYVAAFMPDKGEVLGELSNKFPGSELGAALNPVPYANADGTGGADLYIRNDKFRQVFAADVSRSDAAAMAVEQRPISASAFADVPTAAAWRTIPSWFLVATEDKAISPDLERFEAERAGSTTVEVRSSHVPMISHPGTVTRLIEGAARATTR